MRRINQVNAYAIVMSKQQGDASGEGFTTSDHLCIWNTTPDIRKSGQQNSGIYTPGDLRRFLSGRLHRMKMPRVIEIRDALPRTPGGKIAWRTLVSDSPTP